MPWTEQVAENKAKSAQIQTAKGAHLLPEAHNTGLVDIDPSAPDVTGSVIRTGSELQRRLKENPMSHVNSSPQEFASFCRSLFTENKNSEATRYFSVLLLAADPLHFDARRSIRVSNSEKQAQQYFGKARPVRKNIGGNNFVYTLEVQVVGARVSDLLKDDLQGISLAASVSTRDVMKVLTTSGLSGVCAGTIIKGISDVSHLGTVLTTADELSSGKDRGILRSVSQATGRLPGTIAELAHSHGIDKPMAGALSSNFLKKSTALNPLTESETGEDTFLVHPQLTQQIVIIPFWDELSPEQEKPVSDDADAAVASIALGSLATFGVAGMDQITSRIIEPSNTGSAVPLSSMKQLKR